MNAYSSAGGGGQAVNDGSVTMTRCSAHASGNRGCGQCRGRGRGRGRGRVRVSVRVRVKRGFLPRMPNLYAIQQCARRRSPCEVAQTCDNNKNSSNNNSSLFPLPSTKNSKRRKRRVEKEEKRRGEREKRRREKKRRGRREEGEQKRRRGEEQKRRRGEEEEEEEEEPLCHPATSITVRGGRSLKLATTTKTQRRSPSRTDVLPEVREWCINAPNRCPHGTHTSGTAYTRGTYSRVHTKHKREFMSARQRGRFFWQKALPRVELGFFFASGGDLPPTAPLRRAGRRRSANLKQPHLATRPAANNNKNTRLDTHPDAFCLRHLLPQSFFAPRQFFCSLPASPRLLSASSSSFLLMSFSLFLFLFFSPSLESAPSPEVRPSRCPAPTPSPRLNHPR